MPDEGILPAMPITEHVEKHFSASLTVRDVVIGMSDGLTVPFALAAGLSGAIGTTHIIVTAGLAEIAAGALAMGLGGYLAARTDAEHFFAERDREERETIEIPHVEQEECKEIFRSYGLSEAQVEQVVDAISSDRKRWVDFMMKFELGIESDFHKTEEDVDNYNNQLETYLGGSIKQIVLYFKQEEYDSLITKLEGIIGDMGETKHSELFLKLLEEYEKTKKTGTF